MTNAPQSGPAPVSQPPQAPPPVQRDTTFAWLAHLLMLFTWFVGPLVIWLVKKDEDKYAAFHGKQAMCWALALTALVFCVWILSLLLALVAGPLAFVPMCLMWLALLGNLVYVVIGIVYTAQGRPFKYLFVADLFCRREFAEAYSDVSAPAPAGQAPVSSPPAQSPPPGPTQTPPEGPSAPTT